MKKLLKRIFNPDGKNMIPEDQDAIDYLILNKALEVAGVDSKTGELLYAFTPKVKDIMPELYHEHLNHVNSEIMRMWEKGFVNVDFFAEEPVVTLTEKAFDQAEISKLSQDNQWALEEMKRLMKKRNF
jgi:hypothetical protein